MPLGRTNQGTSFRPPAEGNRSQIPRQLARQVGGAFVRTWFLIQLKICTLLGVPRLQDFIPAGDPRSRPLHGRRGLGAAQEARPSPLGRSTDVVLPRVAGGCPEDATTIAWRRQGHLRRAPARCTGSVALAPPHGEGAGGQLRGTAATAGREHRRCVPTHRRIDFDTTNSGEHLARH